jgi:polyferredoxin
MGRSVHPYDDTAVIDSRAPRTNQAVIGSLALLAFVLDAQWLIALLALQFILGLTLGRRWCLPCLLYFEVIQPRIGEGRIEDARPPRFANQIGAVFLSVATISFLAGAATFAWVLALIVSTLALFSAMSGVCLSCEMYVLIARARGMQLERYPV